tara:strand:+ start:89 stop:406 length:318 start_codon:yes stop_codon:yes gene_type:complete
MKFIIFFYLLINIGYAFIQKPIQKKMRLQDNYFDNDLVNGLGIVILSLPSLMKEGGNCKVDDDCPFIMRCCKVGTKNYCCSPNNFISVDLAYNKQFISKNETTKI